MVQSQYQLWHGRSSHRFYKTRTSANDTRVFCFSADHEAGNILDEKQRRAVTNTSLDEVSDFFRRLCIDDATKPGRATCWRTNHSAMIRDYTHRYSCDRSPAGDHLSGIVCLEFIEMSFIEQTGEKLAHVIRLP